MIFINRGKLIMTNKSIELLTREYNLIKESEVNMVFSIILTVLTIETEYSFSIVKINQIQAIETVDKDDGGIVTITLKGDKSEQIVYAEDSKDRWVESREWLKSNLINLSSEMSKQDVLKHTDIHPGF
jgi:hypothetical protein